MRKNNICKIEETLQEDSKEKQRSKIEKAQLALLKETLQATFNYFDEDDIFIDLSRIDNMKIHKNRVFMDRNGIFRWVSDGAKQNKAYDSKTFDLFVPVMIKGKSFVIYFMLKGVTNTGGNQDNAIGEMGRLTELIQKNNDNNIHVIFQLDGKYIENHFDDFDKSDKYTLTNRYNVKEAIMNTVKGFIEKSKEM